MQQAKGLVGCCSLGLSHAAARCLQHKREGSPYRCHNEGGMRLTIQKIRTMTPADRCASSAARRDLAGNIRGQSIKRLKMTMLQIDTTI